MTEVDFERRLERVFNDAPRMADADLFAARVTGRLERGWATRRWLIGGAGLVGGVIAASQVLMANPLQRFEAAENSARMLSLDLGRLSAPTDILGVVAGGGVGLWAAAAVAVLGMSFVLSRVIEEI